MRRYLCIVVVAVLGACAPAASAAEPSCQPLQVPVSVPLVSHARISAELCVPPDGRPSAVQLLVHGGSYNRFYWDFPDEPERYSYVRKATEAGYATLSVDRLGVGQSTQPLSALVTPGASADALHQLVAKLRAGVLDGRSYERVIYVGHSYGTVYGWIYASRHDDVDAYVLTGMVHFARPYSLAQVALHLQPAFLAGHNGLDPGYVAASEGLRAALMYHAPTAEPAVIARDEQLRDVAVASELLLSNPYLFAPPPLAASLSIDVPALVMLGEHDATICGPPDGLTCTPAAIAAHEAPYYAPAAELTADVVPNTGHVLPLHTTGAESASRIAAWLRDRVPPN